MNYGTVFPLIMKSLSSSGNYMIDRILNEDSGSDKLNDYGSRKNNNNKNSRSTSAEGDRTEKEVRKSKRKTKKKPKRKKNKNF